SGCAAPPAHNPVPASRPAMVAPARSTDEARGRFDVALAAFVKHDDARDWTPEACARVAGMFDEARALTPAFAQAAFDAGLAYERCGDFGKARPKVEQALKEDPSFHAARAKLALYRFKEDGNADAAIDTLQHAVAEGRFTDVTALVDLAAMQMARDGSTPGAGCKDDMACAKLNLHRALALDDAYMPAHNELALYYFRAARRRAAGSKRADVQQLELAALVCSQAIKTDPHYAPIHNTAGLIQYELGRVNNAVAEFGRAVELDPSFFEAQMNYAALNLGFRGFEKAQAAYRRALAVRPNDYDAHLGLAVALRGPMVDGPDEDARRAKLAAVAAELATAKQIDANRPDAYYNEAIFIHELEAAHKSPPESVAILERAEASFRTFLQRARGKPEYDGAIARANERLVDLAVTRSFVQGAAPIQKLPPKPPTP
ncbi:MAG: repeat protein, partial [Labilithrix sp.]|nr:repeat protein [Labilithrix sp.]